VKQRQRTSPWTLLPGVVMAALGLAACGSPEDRAADYLARAEALFAESDYERAKLEAQNAVQIEPRNAEARWLLARIARAEENPRKALEQLAIVVREAPDNAAARVMLGELVLAGGDLRGAGELADEAYALAPADPDVLLLKARVALARGELEAGLEYLDALIAVDPDNVEAAMIKGLALLGEAPSRAYAALTESIERVGPGRAKPLREARIDVLTAMGDASAVERELLALLDDFPGDANIAANAAKFYVSVGRAAEAEDVLRAAVDADPDSAQAKFALAQFQARTLGEPDRAEQTLKDFVADASDDRELQVMLGSFYEGQERDLDALRVYRDVVEAEPGSDAGLAARNRAAAVMFRNGETGAALDELDRLLETAPGNAAALTTRGEIRLARGDYDGAVADLRNALRREPDNTVAAVALARSHRAQGDVSLAEDAYRRLLQFEPDNVDALGELAVLLQARQQYDEAAALYDRLLTAGNVRVARSGLAEVAIARGDLDAAEAQARALVEAGETALGSIQLGKVLQAREAYAQAAERFRDALDAEPASVAAVRGLVGSLTLAGDLPAAEAAAEAFVTDNPGRAQARLLLAGSRIRQGRTAAAREVLEPLVRDEPGLVQAWVVLAGAYPEDRPARMDVYRRGLEANPGQPDLALLLGSEYRRGGDVEAAIALYEDVDARNPGQPLVVNNLAALLLDHRDDAASHRRALELVQPFADRRDPVLLDTLGWAHYRNGNPQRAVQLLERALAASDRVPVIRYHLGMAYLAAEDRVGARRELTAVAESGGDFPGLADALRELAGQEG